MKESISLAIYGVGFLLICSSFLLISYPMVFNSILLFGVLLLLTSDVVDGC